MTIRKPSVAGQFYPSKASELKQMLEDLFVSVENIPNVNRHISGIISPHAGYVYSGYQAAKAYSYLHSKNYKLVCILSPSHRVYFDYTSVGQYAAYRTPLGNLPVDHEAVEVALSCSGVQKSKLGHGSEHAIEVQLPLVQHILGDIPILPLVMGDQSKDNIDRLALCVSKLYAKYAQDILFIASSDLSHFHPAKYARIKDEKFIDLLQKAHGDLLYNSLYSEEVEACGGGPILALLQGLKIRENDIQVLGYMHSGQISKNNDSVVGYTSALLFKEKG